jgi:enamine deaminase RidA (YjgF/YER057c/UK114 family)
MLTDIDPATVPAPRHLTGRPPTSTTVEVSRLFRPEALVEVGVVAAVAG